MLFLEIAVVTLGVSASVFGLFLHFWSKRKMADLEADILKLKEKGVSIQMDSLLHSARTTRQEEA
ncbi:hypothetical protein [Acetobacter orleanensis]|uniref:Uncharacterized protein n=1 Tax=Acetobacter orleanensis TaxID=104099 RepID=A0A4Y3TPN3_9PROT|nr:hypothetical protein [Acetobacter orleanensis]KXV64299.1 hypothetical protein AD949_06180 [Acetobacter orleanensis]PCD79083.1 hypothetical protein CO710_08705 [Acetobacter orleanensis]GAN69389.1 hypothetical protein Abol_034_016 [Acetobacter orleanensis JCM 7639]GBR22361.1 hypothetical protein AA0473_0103 [Acetobacter orleanensis NRIC 0473]GEB83007.1 hypothetical protein AOR01nite_14840 [Acetobacter orleanensis]